MKRISSDTTNPVRIHTFFLLPAFFFAFATMPSHADDDKPARIWGSLGLFPYLVRVDDDADLTLTLHARVTPRFSYFSYQNYRGVFRSGDARFDRSEQNIRWALSAGSPIDLNLQSTLVKDGGNDLWQLGIGWRLHDTSFLEEFFDRLSLTYRLTLQLRRFASANEDAMQLEHFFRLRFPGESGRFYVSGFLDQNFNLDPSSSAVHNPIVTEIQFGVRLFDRFYAVAEYRINQFRPVENHNVALGIEYKFGRQAN